MQKIILDTIEELNKEFGEYCPIAHKTVVSKKLVDFIKQALTKMYKAGIKQEKINTGRIKKRQYENGFKAGQKSREKEIVEIASKKGIIGLIEELEIIEKDYLIKKMIKEFNESLSLTKESK